MAALSAVEREGRSCVDTCRLPLIAGEALAREAPHVCVGKSDVAPDPVQEINARYVKEHALAPAAAPGCLQVRLCPAADGRPRYTGVRMIEHPDVLESAARAKASDTTRAVKLWAHRQRRERRLYQLISPAK